jgi:ornithine cyclodeaminase/alanine dehydrogenase-like protein (mu-crystallin family)
MKLSKRWLNWRRHGRLHPRRLPALAESSTRCARVANHSEDGVIELMPIADGVSYAFKYVNGHPKNTRLGLPTVMAFGLLADVATGTPRLLSELTMTTALRTAAMSALAAKKLARPDSRVMALIGNGAQSEFQALAFRDLVGIEPCACSTSTRRHPQADRQPRRLGLQCASAAAPPRRSRARTSSPP